MFDKNIAFFLLVFFLVAACNQNTVKKEVTEVTTPTGKTISTVYQVSPDIEAEIKFDNSQGTISVLVNDKQCTNDFNLPSTDELEVHEMKLEIDDYNFDGYKDFAIAGGYRAIQYHMNLYNPETQEYVAFETLENVNTDVDNKQLISNIPLSAGERSIWVYSVKGFNKLHTKEHTEVTDYSFFEINNGEIGALSQIVTTSYFDEKGKEKTIRTLLTENGEIVKYSIKNKRAYLYNRPAEAGKTVMYLVAGDEVELIDIAKDFFKIKFINPKYGEIIKWIKYSNGQEM